MYQHGANGVSLYHCIFIHHIFIHHLILLCSLTNTETERGGRMHQRRVGDHGGKMPRANKVSCQQCTLMRNTPHDIRLGRDGNILGIWEGSITAQPAPGTSHVGNVS